MKVLVVGNGAREHALAWRIAANKGADVYITRGNAGTDNCAASLDIPPLDLRAVVSAVREHAIDLVVVGPEAPLCLGLADALHGSGTAVFGPGKEGARIEGSKAHAHELMAAAGVPCADFRVFESPGEAAEFVKSAPWPVVVKADGLAAGKGVIVPNNVDEALRAIHTIMVERKFGAAGERVVIEERLQGIEASYMVMTDGDALLPLPTSRDYKRLLDGDSGPNTGGMGAFSPNPLVEGDKAQAVLDTIFRPLMRELGRRGIEYRGVIYAGLMLTADGPKVLEFNCRFGDPETQAVVMRIGGDLLEAMCLCARGELHRAQLWHEESHAVCVVMASHGYPESPKTGFPIHGLQVAERLPRVRVFHAGTKRLDDGSVVTAGGRVLTVCATGSSLAEARSRACGAASRIRFQGAHYRRDIAL